MLKLQKIVRYNVSQFLESNNLHNLHWKGVSYQCGGWIELPSVNALDSSLRYRQTLQVRSRIIFIVFSNQACCTRDFAQHIHICILFNPLDRHSWQWCHNFSQKTPNSLVPASLTAPLALFGACRARHSCVTRCTRPDPLAEWGIRKLAQ